MSKENGRPLLSGMGDPIRYVALGSEDVNDRAVDPFIGGADEARRKNKALRSIISTPNFLNVELTKHIVKQADDNRAEASGKAPADEDSSEHAQRLLRKQFMDSVKTKFFFLGFSFGASLQSFAVSVILLFVSHSDDSGPIQELSHEYYPMFRAMFLLSFFFLLYGANLFIWRRAKVDVHRVMGFSYSHTYQFVLQGSSACAHVMFSMFIMYVLTITGGFGAAEERAQYKHVWPLLAIVLPMVIFFAPSDKLTQPIFGVDRNGFKQRLGLLGNVLAVMASPFSKVTFHRAFIADVLCSMPKVFTDLEYVLCIYGTGSIAEENFGPASQTHAYSTCGNGSLAFFRIKVALSLFPIYLRLMQSMRALWDTRKMRHAFNGLKYALSLTVGALATLKQNLPEDHVLIYVWFWVSAGTTLYALYWDVVMDWGLGHLRAEHPFLRSSDTLAFAPYTYYCAMCVNAVFRLGWAIYISPGTMILQQHFVLLLGCVELLRRFVWAIFRVEWEHFSLLSEEAVQQRRALRKLGTELSPSRTHVSSSSESFFVQPESDLELAHTVPDVHNVGPSGEYMQVVVEGVDLLDGYGYQSRDRAESGSPLDIDEVLMPGRAARSSFSADDTALELDLPLRHSILKKSRP